MKHVISCAALIAFISGVCIQSHPAEAQVASNLAVHFAADEPPPTIGDGDPTLDTAVIGPAGLLGTVNWNNFAGASGGPLPLNADIGGVSVPTSATITWTSPNTWTSAGRSENNNSAPPGPDRNLMLGYLDSLGVGGAGPVINVSGLGANAQYDLLVYIQGGVNGRRGEYTVTSAAGTATQIHEVNGPFEGAFIVNDGATFISNVLIFSGLSGDAFRLESRALAGTNNTPRAPINGFEIILIPEPTSLLLGGLPLLLLRRRRAA